MLDFTREGTDLTIMMPENITTLNAGEMEEQIMGIVDEQPVEKLVLDADNMVYTSSAGLRIILKLIKKIKNMSIINVSADLYSVFDISGFSKVVRIEKKED